MHSPSETDRLPFFQVFLCYNSQDNAQIRAIAAQLKQRGISYWLDKEQLPPGTFWLETQQQDMSHIGAVAVFIGKHGIGKWQRLEISIFLQQFVAQNLPIIPVFLPDAPPETELMLFLKLFSWVDFRRTDSVAQCTDSVDIDSLIHGITRSPVIPTPALIAQTQKVIADEIQANIPNNLTKFGAKTFVGRIAELDRLRTLLQSSTAVAIGAVQGMGGVGKTELALQFAYQERDRQAYPGGIVWLNARQDLKPQLLLFAENRLGLQPPADRPLDAQLEWCWQHWGRGRTLLVLDDVQDFADVEALGIPGRSQFQSLLTTRRNFGAAVQQLSLEVLSEAEAIKLLRSLVTDGRMAGQEAEAAAICEWLGYLPLGLELVGRYLARKPDVSWAMLRQRLQDKRLDARALQERSPGMTAALGVAAAFELSWQELPPPAQELAARLSLFALADIPWYMVVACSSETDEEELEELRDEMLVDRSWLKRTEAGHYRLHQLLREFFGAKRREMAESEGWEGTFFDGMIAEANRSSNRPTRSLLEETTAVIPHLQGAIDWVEATQQTNKATQQTNKIAAGKAWLGYVYRSQGRYSEAEPLYLQALEIRRSQLGNDHPYTASS
ncbi:MAG: TIR domain-containing protein, partial [Oculatellaceae cyanobacterium Prado106]|nr:TIR domain-containing protein [Oculatellaceae cyanobacterium Prado106]